MLRVSVSQSSLQVDLSGYALAIHGRWTRFRTRTLIGLADAFMDHEPEHLANIRDEAASVIGELGVIEAIGVAANFQRMVRIASGTVFLLTNPTLNSARQCERHSISSDS